MGEPLHRTQVLLRKNQHAELSALASREGTSVSKLIRTLVDEGLERRDKDVQMQRERRLRSLERIREHGRSALERRGGELLDVDVAELIREMREERDEELVSRLTAGGD